MEAIWTISLCFARFCNSHISSFLYHVAFELFLVSAHVVFFHSATTHTDLVLRAHQLNIPYQVIHNASIMNAVGCCGLQVRGITITKTM